MLLLPKVTRVIYKSDDEEKHGWKKDMNIAGVKGQKRTTATESLFAVE